MGQMKLTLKSQIHNIALKAEAKVEQVVKEIHVDVIREVHTVTEVPVDVVREVEKRVEVPFETIVEKLIFIKSIPSWILYLVGVETAALVVMVYLLHK